jgi:hypothetical protein
LTGASEPTKYRIAKAAFLQNSEHDHIVKVVYSTNRFDFRIPTIDLSFSIADDAANW